MNRIGHPRGILPPTLVRLLVLVLAPPAVAALAQSGDAMQQAHALLGDYREQTARDYPEWATWHGNRRFDDRLRPEAALGRFGPQAAYCTAPPRPLREGAPACPPAPPSPLQEGAQA